MISKLVTHILVLDDVNSTRTIPVFRVTPANSIDISKYTRILPNESGIERWVPSDNDFAFQPISVNSKLIHLTGDLLVITKAGKFDVIIQGCNCFNTMRSGIANQIRAKWPLVAKADAETSSGDYNKLGCFTSANVTAGNGHQVTVVNAYTQFRTREYPGQDVFEYTSFELILQKLVHRYPGARFGFPEIGCGLAGGNRVKILNMLDRFATCVANRSGTVTVVQYEPAN